ncbi:MAG: hypothetical protein SFT92_01150 [Rickettsiales bacterium]|nr:hypothetical protein [Rickettsiales bacterium]
MHTKHREKTLFAKATDPMIEAVIGGFFRFTQREEAQARLHDLASMYVVSKRQPTNGLHLWVRHYDISQEEKKKGFRGHFMTISITEQNGMFSLRAIKDQQPLAKHPQKDRPDLNMPDMGHYLLRASRKGKIYPSREAAYDALMQLHDMFPATTIPGRSHLFTMIYDRNQPPDARTVKYILRIQPKEKEGFVIILELNRSPKSPDQNKKLENKGLYTSMVQKSRRKKPKKSN